MKKDTENSNGDREILACFAKREYAEPPGHPFTIISHALSLADSDSEGYDPYNKPAPSPSGAEPEQ